MMWTSVDWVSALSPSEIFLAHKHVVSGRGTSGQWPPEEKSRLQSVGGHSLCLLMSTTVLKGVSVVHSPAWAWWNTAEKLGLQHRDNVMLVCAHGTRTLIGCCNNQVFFVHLFDSNAYIDQFNFQFIFYSLDSTKATLSSTPPLI